MRTTASLLVLIVVGAFTPPAWATPALSYVGSPLIADTILPEAAAAFARRTGVGFDHVGREGSGPGLSRVMRGQAEMVGVARALSPGEKDGPIVHYIVGYRALVIAVHADNPVTALTLTQAKDIFRGKIRNWRQVGGANAPIVAVLPRASIEAGSMVAFQRRVMLWAPYRTDRVESDDGPGLVTTMRANPSGITLISQPYLDAGLRAVKIDGRLPERALVQSGLYPLSEPLVMVLARRHRLVARRFVEFLLSPEGQQIVDRHLVRIGP